MELVIPSFLLGHCRRAASSTVICQLIAIDRSCA
jgi:hypothetical protein